MREVEIMELKQNILKGNSEFLDILVDIMKDNKIIYSDNYGNLTDKEKKTMCLLEPFMHLLYRGSKHSVGKMCENRFTRVVIHKGVNLKLVYNSGPDIFVSVEKLNNIQGIKPIVTFELLQQRLQESEDVKNELAPIIEKYLKQGLTFEEITGMFVEIMRENRIKL